MTPTWIAEKRVVFMEPDGSRTAGRIAVAQPVAVDDHEASCVIVLETASSHKYPPIVGGSTLQALLLGLRLLGYELHHFLERAGRVLDPDEDEDVSLDALFGPLVRAPAPAADRHPDDLR
jgi:hypothetical protein